jgi:hypothetical protein
LVEREIDVAREPLATERMRRREDGDRASRRERLRDAARERLVERRVLERVDRDGGRVGREQVDGAERARGQRVAAREPVTAMLGTSAAGAGAKKPAPRTGSSTAAPPASASSSVTSCVSARPISI